MWPTSKGKGGKGGKPEGERQKPRATRTKLKALTPEAAKALTAGQTDEPQISSEEQLEAEIFKAAQQASLEQQNREEQARANGPEFIKIPDKAASMDEQLNGVWKNKIMGTGRPQQQLPPASMNLPGAASRVALEAQERARVNAQHEAMIGVVDRMFDHFQNLAYDFNQVASASDLELTWIRPSIARENVGSWHQGAQYISVFSGRISTRYWTLVVRGTYECITAHIIPADKLLTFNSAPGSFMPMLVLVPYIDGTVVCWSANERQLRSGDLEQSFRAVLDSLVQVAQEDVPPTQPIDLFAAGVLHENSPAQTSNFAEGGQSMLGGDINYSERYKQHFSQDKAPDQQTISQNFGQSASTNTSASFNSVNNFGQNASTNTSTSFNSVNNFRREPSQESSDDWKPITKNVRNAAQSNPGGQGMIPGPKMPSTNSGTSSTNNGWRELTPDSQNSWPTTQARPSSNFPAPGSLSGPSHQPPSPLQSSQPPQPLQSSQPPQPFQPSPLQQPSRPPQSAQASQSAQTSQFSQPGQQSSPQFQPPQAPSRPTKQMPAQGQPQAPSPNISQPLAQSSPPPTNFAGSSDDWNFVPLEKNPQGQIQKNDDVQQPVNFPSALFADMPANLGFPQQPAKSGGLNKPEVPPSIPNPFSKPFVSPAQAAATASSVANEALSQEIIQRDRAAKKGDTFTAGSDSPWSQAPDGRDSQQRISLENAGPSHMISPPPAPRPASLNAAASTSGSVSVDKMAHDIANQVIGNVGSGDGFLPSASEFQQAIVDALDENYDDVLEQEELAKANLENPELAAADAEDAAKAIEEGRDNVVPSGDALGQGASPDASDEPGAALVDSDDDTEDTEDRDEEAADDDDDDAVENGGITDSEAEVSAFVENFDKADSEPESEANSEVDDHNEDDEDERDEAENDADADDIGDVDAAAEEVGTASANYSDADSADEFEKVRTESQIDDASASKSESRSEDADEEDDDEETDGDDELDDNDSSDVEFDEAVEEAVDDLETTDNADIEATASPEQKLDNDNLAETAGEQTSSSASGIDVAPLSNMQVEAMASIASLENQIFSQSEAAHAQHSAATMSPAASLTPISSSLGQQAPHLVSDSQHSIKSEIERVISAFDKELEIISSKGSEAFARRDLKSAEHMIKLAETLSEYKDSLAKLKDDYEKDLS